MTKDKKTDGLKLHGAVLGSLRDIAQSMKMAAKNNILTRNTVTKASLKSLQEKAQLMDLAEKFGEEYDALTKEYPLRNSRSRYTKDKS